MYGHQLWAACARVEWRKVVQFFVVSVLKKSGRASIASAIRSCQSVEFGFDMPAMPELAEVEYYRKRWDPGVDESVQSFVANREKRLFRDVDFSAMDTFLRGAKLIASMAKGKQLCFRFGTEQFLGIHLGMTGKLRHSATDAYERGTHDHLVIHMSGNQSLVFNDPRMFGRVRYAASIDEADWWTDLAPEILSDEFTFEVMDAFLSRREKAPLKSVLLMQERFPGVGNWMADEILWRSRLHPASRAVRLNVARRKELYTVILEVCADALRVIGDDWSTPPDDWLFNHRWKDGGRCPKTGVELKRETIGGRTTCWSPKWQKNAPST